MPPNPLTLLTINILIFQFGPLRKKKKKNQVPVIKREKEKKRGRKKKGRGGGVENRRKKKAQPFLSPVTLAKTSRTWQKRSLKIKTE